MGRVRLVVLTMAVLWGTGCQSSGRPAHASSSQTLASEITAQQASPTTAQDRCHTPALAIAYSTEQGAAGSIDYEFTITNKGSAACSLYGYVGVAAYDESKKEVRIDPVRDNPPEPKMVVLAPGKIGYFGLQAGDNAGPCKTARSLHITPPDEKSFAEVPMEKFLVCGNGRVDIFPIRADQAGYGES